MEKDHEEYNIGVLDIYGFEIFQVRPVWTTGAVGGGCLISGLKERILGNGEKTRYSSFLLVKLFMYLY